jgi:hypothetical protein
MNRVSRFATAVEVSGGLSLAGLGLATGTAQADPAWGPSYSAGNCPAAIGTCTHWCPGDPLIPGSQVITWDWNICHDWYWNSEGVVDINANMIYPWHGVPHEAPPPPPPLPPYTPPPPAAVTAGLPVALALLGPVAVRWALVGDIVGPPPTRGGGGLGSKNPPRQPPQGWDR